jgi:hypothetical protein
VKTLGVRTKFRITSFGVSLCLVFSLPALNRDLELHANGVPNFLGVNTTFQ